MPAGASAWFADRRHPLRGRSVPTAAPRRPRPLSTTSDSNALTPTVRSPLPQSTGNILTAGIILTVAAVTAGIVIMKTSSGFAARTACAGSHRPFAEDSDLTTCRSTLTLSVEQLFLGHGPVPIPQQQSDDVENLRLHGHGTIRTGDLESVEVHGVTASEKPHSFILAAALSSRSPRPAGGLRRGVVCPRCDLPWAFGDLQVIG